MFIFWSPSEKAEKDLSAVVPKFTRAMVSSKPLLPSSAPAILNLMKSTEIQDSDTQILWDFTKSKKYQNLTNLRFKIQGFCFQKFNQAFSKHYLEEKMLIYAFSTLFCFPCKNSKIKKCLGTKDSNLAGKTIIIRFSCVSERCDSRDNNRSY